MSETGDYVTHGFLVAMYRAMRLRFAYLFESCDANRPRNAKKPKRCETKALLFFPLLTDGSQELVLKAPKGGQFHAASRVRPKGCDLYAQSALGKRTVSQVRKNSLKIKCLGSIFLRHPGPKRRDIPDKNFMQVALFCCFRQGVPGMSRDLGRDVPDLEKLYARKLWADFSHSSIAAKLMRCGIASEARAAAELATKHEMLMQNVECGISTFRMACCVSLPSRPKLLQKPLY